MLVPSQSVGQQTNRVGTAGVSPPASLTGAVGDKAHLSCAPSPLYRNLERCERRFEQPGLGTLVRSWRLPIAVNSLSQSHYTRGALYTKNLTRAILQHLGDSLQAAEQLLQPASSTAIDTRKSRRVAEFWQVRTSVGELAR